MYEFPACCATRWFWKRRPPGAACSRSIPNATAFVRRVPMICWPRARHAVIKFRNVAGGDRHDTIFIKSDKAGITSLGVKGFQIPTDLNGQLWVHFAHHDTSILVSALDLLEGRVPLKKSGASWC